MSQHDAGTVPPPEVEQQNEEERFETRAGDPAHDEEKEKVNLARISDIDTGLRFAEREQNVEDELLEASLEEYQ